MQNQKNILSWDAHGFCYLALVGQNYGFYWYFYLFL